MALFSQNPLRSAATVAIALSVAHFGTKLMTSLHAFQWTQTSIAFLSLLALLAIILTHHRMDGQLVSRGQEEAMLIVAFALCWVVMIVGWQFFRSDGRAIGTIVDTQKGLLQKAKDPCLGDNVYCIYEEYTYY